MKITSVILAAGKGTRMRSDLPKVLHPLGGRPLIWYSLNSASQVSSEIPVVVIGHDKEEVQRWVGDAARFVVQEPQLGTGHAVQATESLLANQTDLILVCYSDMPLLTAATFQRVIDTQMQNSGPLTILTLFQEDAHGFGRIVRMEDGSVEAIVEEVAATPQQLAIKETNVSVYCIQADWLWDALRRIPISVKGEYFLTDLVGIAVEDNLKVQAVVMDDIQEAIGINTRIHLAEAESFLRRRINRAWMDAGVTMLDPETVYIEPDVTVGRDTVIYPNTFLRGTTQIGEGCQIGPNSILENCQVGNHCRVLASVLDGGSVLEDDVEMGPFCHLRKGAHLSKHVHLGNFGEVKNSYLAEGVKMGHFSYIGDAQIGENVNIGAGTITCNYDGEKKHKTEIGANAFVGSDTMLVAPVKLGENSRTGAGAVVTHDVPDGTTVVGVPARPLIKKVQSE